MKERFQPNGPGVVDMREPLPLKAINLNGDHPEAPDALLDGEGDEAAVIERLGFHDGKWSPCPSDWSQKDAVPMGVLYDSGKLGYVSLSEEETWIPVKESAVRRHLQQEHGISDKKSKTGLGSKVDQALHHITHKTSVAWAGTMPGYFTGVYSVGPCQRMLVSSSPVILRPRPGDCRVILTLLEQLLGAEQATYFHGWLATAYRSLVNRTFVPGQCLVLAGPKDCGKTFVQNQVITPVVGGREGKPYQYMTGKTPFNADLFLGEHLVMSDEVAHIDIASRRQFGSKIKDLLVNPTQRYHAKNINAHMTAPFWRMSLSTNHEPENLKVLPPIDDSIKDKLIILKASTPECLPATEEDRPSFLAAIKRELPAYVAFLKNFEIPDHLKSGRFGITHFHNEEILAALDELAPENELLVLIDQALFQSAVPEDWEGTASDLYGKLINDDSPVRYEARKLLQNGISCGIYLSRLAKKHGISPGKNRVRQRLLDGQHLYQIEKPARSRTV